MVPPQLTGSQQSFLLLHLQSLNSNGNIGVDASKALNLTSLRQEEIDWFLVLMGPAVGGLQVRFDQGYVCCFVNSSLIYVTAIISGWLLGSGGCQAAVAKITFSHPAPVLTGTESFRPSFPVAITVAREVNENGFSQFFVVQIIVCISSLPHRPRASRHTNPLEQSHREPPRPTRPSPGAGKALALTQTGAAK